MTATKCMLLTIGLLGSIVAGFVAGNVVYALGASGATALCTGAGAGAAAMGLFFAGVAAFR